MEDSEEKNKISVRELTMKHGLSFPSDEELLMLMLGTGSHSMPVQQLAKEVLNTIAASNEDNLVDNLLKIKGMGKSKALLIAASLEFSRRINKNPQVSITSPGDIIPYIQIYAMNPREHFLCISLNGAREILSIRVICSGSGNMAIIRTSEVFCEAIKEHASAIVISHNHPSGNPAPSEKDLSTTLRILKASQLLGIPLLDHIIISKKGYFSFLEHELIDEEKLEELA